MTLTLASLGILLFTLNTIKCFILFYFILTFYPYKFCKLCHCIVFTKDNNKQTNWKMRNSDVTKWQMIMPHDYTFKYTSELFLAKSACLNLIFNP